MRLLGARGCALALAFLAAWHGAAAKKSKKDKAAAKAEAERLNCETCQSVAHLLVKSRKTEKNSSMSNNEVVGMLFSDRNTIICTEDKLQPYADFLELKVMKMIKRCLDIVPEKFEYKSAQDLKRALADGTPRSQVAQMLCVDSARCEKLWTKEQEPWHNWKKKKEEM